MSARPTYRTIAAAVCPDGKLEVGGPASRCGTDGRSRSTRNVVVTNVVTSITSAPTRNAMCAQWRPIARMTTATAATPTTVTVSPSLEPHTVSSSNVGVRWSKNQRLSRVVPPADRPVEEHLGQEQAEAHQEDAS